MKYEDLLDIIKTGEGYTIEFKESINTSLGKEICAFAKSSGGKIIIGVDDHNRIKSYKLKESLREALINAMVHKDYLFPSNVQINISPLKVEIVNAGKLLFPKKEFGKLSAYRNPIIADLMQRLNK